MCRSIVYDEFQYDSNFSLAQDYHIFVRVLSRFKGANMSDILVHYRRHGGNTHKKSVSQHLFFLSKIFDELFNSFQVESYEADLEIWLLISDSSSRRLGLSELVRIDKWLFNFKQYCLQHNLYSLETLDTVLSYVWKECYWKIDRKGVFYYTRLVNKYKSWTLFSLADIKFFIKNIISS